MKKVVSIVFLVICILCLSSMAFAKTFSDVKSTKYATSIDLLTELGIVDGYTDGTYKPDNTVTRAEMAKLIVVALGKESTAESLKGKTNFGDVKEDSWATGYINCAVSIEIIKGYTDGTFKPNQTVTYAEASTMLLRALNYNKELENEVYPLGYMKKANEAGILANVTANSSTDGAIRGNIAVMLVNTLKGGVRKIVATTTKGGVEYGDGAPLIETAFKDFKYVKEGEVVDIDFDDNEIYIRDKVNSRRVTLSIEDDDELMKLFMRKVRFLYDSKNEKLYSFEIIDDYKLVTIDVDEVDEEIIYDEDDNEYELPDSDYVLMAYISNYDDADTAYLVMNGKKAISAILVGTPKIYIGVVTDYGFQVDKRNGFEIITPEGKYEEYALNNTSEKLKEGAVLLFSLNNSEYAIIHDKVYSDDAFSIEALTSDSITLKKKSKIQFARDTEYYVYSVSKDDIEEIKLKDIEQEFDLAYIVKFSDVYYVIVFEDTVDDEDIVSSLSVSEAREKLEATIKKAKTYIKKESSYSIDSYEELNDAYKSANAALNGSSSAAKLELAERKLSNAIASLKNSSSSDKQLRLDFAELEDKIAEAESKKAADYTADSFANLQAEIKTAKAVKITSTTSSKISDRIDALEKAINLLVTNAANTEIQSALKTLNSLITKAETAIKNKASYTENSIKKVNNALTNAKKLDQSKASLSEIKTQSSNLEAALDDLESIGFSAYISARKDLDATYKKATNVTKSNYTKESYEMFLEAFNPLKTEYSKLKSSADVALLSANDVKAETELLKKLNTRIEDAMKKLVTITDSTYRASLKEYIAKGRTYTEATWKNTDVISYKALVARLDAADKLVNNAASTEQDIQSMLLELIRYGL